MRRSFCVLCASVVLFVASAAQAQPFLLDHFNVYDAFGEAPPVSGVDLTDQFGSGVTALGPPLLFMAPALKNEEPINDRIGHLTCYEIADPGPAGPPVLANNQFGSETLTLGQRKVLCVPSGDPRWKDVQDLGDIPYYLQSEIEHFFEVYKALEPDKSTDVRGWDDRAAAERAITEALEAYPGS